MIRKVAPIFIMLLKAVLLNASTGRAAFLNDQSSLLAIKTHFTSDSNAILAKNWTQGTSFCTWIGVICSRKHFRVTALNLSYMGLQGVIPREISKLSFLTYLDISNNSFNGQIPDEIGNLRRLRIVIMKYNQLTGLIPLSLGLLSNLQHLILRGNSLSGAVPWGIFNFSKLTQIDLRVNHLSGTLPIDICHHLPNLEILLVRENEINGDIPNSLGKCAKLKVLELSINRFSGSIPMEIGNLSQLQFFSVGRSNLTDLKDLKYLDLSFNNLYGSIPQLMETLQNLDYFNVSFNELSGEIPNGGNFVNFAADSFKGNVDLCGASRFKVEACKNINVVQTPSSSKRLLRYILPPIFSIVVVATIVILFLKCCGKKAILFSTLSNKPGLVLERISYYEIVRATNNFDEGNLIGSGSYGLVYKGVFSDEKIYAVKVFNSDMQQALKSFDTECQIMRKIRHRNLVKVITSCSNLDFKALVLTYITNGNLDKWLYSSDLFLTFVQRLGVMIDVASAIEYLHLWYSSPIVHCDLKPSNILMDEDMIAYVGDFGIAKLLTEDQRMEQTKTLGTIGYMAPEYGSTGLVSTMADVYSYGILLMETFTRKKPTNEMFIGELTLTKLVSESFPDHIMQIVDGPLLNSDGGISRTKYEKCLTSVLGVSLECATEIPEVRLKMNEVVSKLQKIKTELLH